MSNEQEEAAEAAKFLRETLATLKMFNESLQGSATTLQRAKARLEEARRTLAASERTLRGAALSAESLGSTVGEPARIGVVLPFRSPR